MLMLYQREKIPDRVRDDFGAIASTGLPGGIRALVPPEPIPSSAKIKSIQVSIRIDPSRPIHSSGRDAVVLSVQPHCC